MALRFLRNPAFLSSLAVHALLVVGGLYLGHVVVPAHRPALLLGVETREISGSVDAEAPLPPPEPPLDFEPIPDVVPDPVTPEEVAELPPPDDTPVADSMPPFFDVVPVGVRNAVKAKPLANSNPEAAAPSVTPPVSPPVPRPPVAFAPSRRGSRAETRAAERIGNAPPSYPLEALRRHWEGTAILDVRVTAQGAVSEATIYESSGSRVLDDASIAAALGYRYLPRLVDDVPAPDWLRVPFVWRITGP